MQLCFELYCPSEETNDKGVWEGWHFKKNLLVQEWLRGFMTPDCTLLPTPTHTFLFSNPFLRLCLLRPVDQPGLYQLLPPCQAFWLGPAQRPLLWASFPLHVKFELDFYVAELSCPCREASPLLFFDVALAPQVGCYVTLGFGLLIGFQRGPPYLLTLECPWKLQVSFYKLQNVFLTFLGFIASGWYF